jgi:hypothetical protein
MLQRPENTEYNAYFQRYIDLVPVGNFNELYHDNTEGLVTLFSTIPIDLHGFRYAEGKWTAKDMLMHIIDTERVFSYRMLVAARGDGETPLHRMEEDAYAANVDVSSRSMESLLDEFKVVRKSIEYLLVNISEEKSRFLANAITYKVTARALAYITIGHASHHMNILRERYLSVQS